MGKTPRCTKAVAYIRVSTTKQEISPQMQLERIQAYCEMKGLQLVETICEHVSARKNALYKRPEGSNLAKLIAEGVCHVVALKLDRIFRNAADALTTVERWDKAGIALHLVDMGGISLDTKSPMGKMLLTLLSGVAEWEAAVIAERTSTALQHQKAHGEVYTRSVYGWDAVDGKMVANAEEQSVISRMTSLRADGISYSEIALILNAECIPTKRAGTWGAQTVYNILQR